MKIFVIECRTEEESKNFEKILKNFAMEYVKNDVQAIENQTIEERAKVVLYEFGALVKNLGYQYIIEAMKLLDDDYGYIRCIVKKIYPEIAKKYNATPVSVERSIRHEILLMNGNDNFVKVIGNKTTNKEFLAKMYQYCIDK